MVLLKEVMDKNKKLAGRFAELADQSRILAELRTIIDKSEGIVTSSELRENLERVLAKDAESPAIRPNKETRQHIEKLLRLEKTRLEKSRSKIETILPDLDVRFKLLEQAHADIDRMINSATGFFTPGSTKYAELKNVIKTIDKAEPGKLMEKIGDVVHISRIIIELFESVASLEQAISELNTIIQKEVISKHSPVEQQTDSEQALTHNFTILSESIKRACQLKKEVISFLDEIMEAKRQEITRLDLELKRSEGSIAVIDKELERSHEQPELQGFRVLLLTHEYEKGGGVASVTKRLTATLSKHGKVTVDVVVRQPKIFGQPSKPYAFYYGGEHKQELGQLDDLLSVLRQVRYDVIHTHSLSFCSLFQGGLSDIMELNKDAPLIYTCHSLVRHERDVQNRYRPWGTAEIEAQGELFAKADKITHLTNFGRHTAHGTAEEFKKATKKTGTGYYPQYNDKAYVVPNGIDLQYSFFQNRVFSLLDFDRKKDKLGLAYIGRLAEEKGVVTLVEIFPEVIAKHPRTRLTIVGTEHPGSGVENLMRYYLRSVPEDRYEFVGWKEGDELKEEYKKSDVVIVPSFNESFCIVALEAMSFFKPVIISNVDGPRELFVEPGSAVGIDPLKPHTIVSAIDYCYNHPYELKKKVEAGREQIKKKYNWGSIGQEYEKIYDSMVRNIPFDPDFKPPVSIAPVPEIVDPVRPHHKVGLYYGQEFWSSFIHLLDEEGYPVDTYGIHFDRVIKKRNLEKFVQDNDVIITCSASAHNWMVISDLCKRYNKPHILRYGGGMGLKQDNIQKEEFKEALRSAHIVAPTDLLSSKVMEKIGIPTSRQVIVPNPVEFQIIDKIETDTNVLRGRFGLPLKKCILGFVGRLDPMRNVYYVVEAYYQYCKHLKQKNIPNNMTLLIQGKLMENYSIAPDYFPGVQGNFAEKLRERIAAITDEFGGTIHQMNSDNIEVSNEGCFGKENIIYKPLDRNVKQEQYLSLLAACNIVSILPGFGVGSNRAIAEALALKRRILTIQAITNPYVYGPAGMFVKSQKSTANIQNHKCFLPELQDLVNMLKNINDKHKKYLKDFPEGRRYIEETMESSFLVYERLIPAIDALLKTFDPATGNFDETKIKKMFKDSLHVMKSRFHPEKGLEPV
jgi:glycosyltransferase involved in cell wall biosynthesis